MLLKKLIHTNKAFSSILRGKLQLQQHSNYILSNNNYIWSGLINDVIDHNGCFRETCFTNRKAWNVQFLKSKLLFIMKLQ